MNAFLYCLARPGITVACTTLLLLATTPLLSQPMAPAPEPDEAEQEQMVIAKLHAEQGGMFWVDSLQISFDAVTYSARGEERRRNHIAWNRLTDSAFVSGTLDDGRAWQAQLDSVGSVKGTISVDGVTISPDEDSASLRFAYEIFNDNTRALLLPQMVRDTGVIVQVVGDTIIDFLPRLELEVIFTKSPIEPYRYRIWLTRGLPGISRHQEAGVDYDWSELAFIGPFLIAQRRELSGGGGYVRFEDIEFEWLGEGEAPWAELLRMRHAQMQRRMGTPVPPSDGAAPGSTGRER